MATDPVTQLDTPLSSVADRIAGEVEASAALGLRKISKITSVHHAFRDSDTSPAFAEIEQILQEHDVAVQKVPLDCGRNGGVELIPVEHTGRPSAVSRHVDLQVTRWRPGVAGETLSADGSTTHAPDDILWFNLTAAATPEGPPQDELTAVVEDVGALLAPWGLDLEADMVLDLMSPDPQPKVDTYGDERNGIRHVSAMAVVAREIADGDDRLDGVDEQLVFQLVENLTGDRWIISCWHPARLLTGTASAPPSGTPSREPLMALLQEPFLQQVRRQWDDPGNNMRTAGDLGMALARELAHTFAASQRMIERWVQSTEVEFFDHLSDEADGADAAAAEIRHMLAIVGEFRRSLTAFEHARTATADRSWFPRLSGPPKGDENPAVQALAGIIEGAQEKLEVVFKAIRADMDLLMLQSMGRQQRASEDQQRASVALQDKITKVTVLFLVPTLIAGIFGANTALPGGDRWVGFELMLALMVFSSIAIYAVIKPKRAPVPASTKPPR